VTETRTEPTFKDVLPDQQDPEAVRDQFGEPGQEPASRSGRRQRHLRWIIALIAVCAGVALWSMLWQPRTVSQLQKAEPKPPPAAAPESAKPRYPIEATVAALPPLDSSDSVMIAALQALWSGGGIASFLEPRDVIRNFVATVDNLPRRALPAQKFPVKPAAGSFGTASSGGGLVIGESNSLRYAPYVRLLETVDAQGLVTLYVRNYPLFQQAYRELGYPNGHFNDRLVEAIDMMLATPESPGPLKVVQPKIFYEYADRDLEQLPAGQKLMLRIGRQNAASVKKRLREIRALITAQVPQAVSERSELTAPAKAGAQ
jgi:hypothetical protein